MTTKTMAASTVVGANVYALTDNEGNWGAGGESHPQLHG